MDGDEMMTIGQATTLRTTNKSHHQNPNIIITDRQAHLSGEVEITCGYGNARRRSRLDFWFQGPWCGYGCATFTQ
jgi:hypothetical protein